MLVVGYLLLERFPGAAVASQLQQGKRLDRRILHRGGAELMRQPDTSVAERHRALEIAPLQMRPHQLKGKLVEPGIVMPRLEGTQKLLALLLEFTATRSVSCVRSSRRIRSSRRVRSEHRQPALKDQLLIPTCLGDGDRLAHMS